MKKSKNEKIKIVALILILVITLGYAALRTGLNINGTANVSRSSWSVYFDNYQNSNNTNITPTTEPSISGTTTTSISYEVDLEAPGDLYEFTVDVVNGGSLDALISLVSKYNNTEIDAQHPVPAYVTYSVTDENGDAIVDGHTLTHGESETVKVLVKYRDDDPSVLPQSGTSLSFDLEIVAIKAPKGGAPADEGTYTIDAAPYDATRIVMGHEIPNGVTIYHSPAEAIATWEGLTTDTRPMFLKHTLDNNIVTESYVGLVVSDDFKTKLKADYCSYEDERSATCRARVDSMPNGTYYFRGGVNEASLGTGNQPVYEANKSVALSLFPNGGCTETEDGLRCDVDGDTAFIVDVDYNGYINVSLAFVYEEEHGGFCNCGIVVDAWNPETPPYSLCEYQLGS